MQEILLKGGMKAYVSNEDYQIVNCHTWYPRFEPSGICYAVTFIKNKTVYLHRFIMNPKIGKVVDHIDGYGLNNTRENLRVCSRQENRYNSQKRKDSRFKYKGVGYNVKVQWFGKKSRKVIKNKEFPFSAKITAKGKQYFLGVFKTEEEAGRAYDEAAKKYHGAYARLNFG